MMKFHASCRYPHKYMPGMFSQQIAASFSATVTAHNFNMFYTKDILSYANFLRHLIIQNLFLLLYRKIGCRLNSVSDDRLNLVYETETW